MNKDAQLCDLARSADIAVEWTDAADQPQTVSPAVLRAVLAALGLPAATPTQIAQSAERLRAEAASASPPLVTGTVGQPIVLGESGGKVPSRAALTTGAGARRDVSLEQADNRVIMPAIDEAGYHTLDIGDRTVTLAVAPQRCFSLSDVGGGRRLWGVAAQLYGLRDPGDGGIGNMGGLSAFAAGAAQAGADVVAISPTHAMFGADLRRYGPYSPSSRLFLNPLYADPAAVFGRDRVAAAVAAIGLSEQSRAFEAAALIDWPGAAAVKLKVFRRLFEDFQAGRLGAAEGLAQSLADFRSTGGGMLHQHALFETLHRAQLATSAGAWNWRQWPGALRDPQSADVQAFAVGNTGEIDFQIFLQWIADRSFAQAQATAKSAGMRIGIVADLAIGMDAGGSHAWSRQHDLLVGLNVGAPPDLFNPHGQDWGLTAFSPRALRASGYAPFIATLRAALLNAGGVRIDHALGLQRLWLVPEGVSPTHGAYLRYPLTDLLRLICLESARHRAIIIGEDLGTVPAGFPETLASAGIAGMRVLWFERDRAAFRPPETWSREAVAMTSTHDLPTVAGWWGGADIETRAALGLMGDDKQADAEQGARTEDRALLWAAFYKSGATRGRTLPDDADDAVDAAVRFVASTPSELAIVPLEDMLGLAEQPNLPGTVDIHPNWRRRYPDEAGAEFDHPRVQRRAGFLTARGER